MKLKVLFIVLGVLLLPLVGCSNSPNAADQDQKKILKVYLEGLRDRDFAKLQKTTDPVVFQSWPQDPVKLREYLAASQKNGIGTIKSWEFEEKPFVDQLNGQTIIRTTLLTDRYKFIMDYDLRKQEKTWGVYGVQSVNQVSLQKTQGKIPTKMTP